LCEDCLSFVVVAAEFWSLQKKCGSQRTNRVRQTLVALAAPAPLPPLRHKGRRRRASPLSPLSVRPLFFRPRPPPWGSPRSRACLREPVVFLGQGLHPDPTHSCFSCTRGRLLNHRKASLAYEALSLGVTDMWRRPWPRAPVGLAARAPRAKKQSINTRAPHCRARPRRRRRWPAAPRVPPLRRARPPRRRGPSAARTAGGPPRQPVVGVGGGALARWAPAGTAAVEGRRGGEGDDRGTTPGGDRPGAREGVATATRHGAAWSTGPPPCPRGRACPLRVRGALAPPSPWCCVRH